jgi:hypothetical protein
VVLLNIKHQHIIKNADFVIVPYIFDPEDIFNILDYLSSNTNLRKLIFKNILHILKHDLFESLFKLKLYDALKGITHLNLSNNDLSHEDMVNIAMMLIKGNNLVHIDLTNNIITIDAIQLFISTLSENGFKKEREITINLPLLWDLGSREKPKLTQEKSDKQTELVKQFNTNFNIVASFLEDTESEYVIFPIIETSTILDKEIESLRNNQVVKNLIFINIIQMLINEYIEKFNRIRINLQKIKYLNISNTNLNSQHVEQLIKLLQIFTHIETIDFRFNYFTFDDLQNLVNALNIININMFKIINIAPSIKDNDIGLIML